MVILVAGLVVTLVVEPVGQSTHGLGDVVRVHFEVVVIDVAALVEEWLVDEVPSRLVSSTLGLQLISEGSALNHGVLVLAGNELGVRLLENGQDSLDILNGLRTLLLENVVGDSGGQEMASSIPGTSAVD